MHQSPPNPPLPAAPPASLFGRLAEPTVATAIEGPCGDVMEFSLRIEDEVITDLRYATNGCGATRLCGEAVGRRALGRTVREALDISAHDILEQLPALGLAHRHCAILAVSALYRALGTHWVIKLIQAAAPRGDPAPTPSPSP